MRRSGGRKKYAVVPSPGIDRISSEPLCASAIAFAMGQPLPTPGDTSGRSHGTRRQPLSNEVRAHARAPIRHLDGDEAVREDACRELDAVARARKADGVIHQLVKSQNDGRLVAGDDDLALNGADVHLDAGRLALRFQRQACTLDDRRSMRSCRRRHPSLPGSGEGFHAPYVRRRARKRPARSRN